MKHLIKLLFLLAFIAPFASVSATTHDDATMHAIEHSDSERYEHEVELPDTDDEADHADDANHVEDHSDANDDRHDDKDDASDDKDDSADDKDDLLMTKKIQEITLCKQVMIQSNRLYS